MTSPSACFLALDVGKTSVRCALYTPSLQQLTLTVIDSADPAETQSALRTHLLQLTRSHPIAAAGISTFGPLDTDPASSTFGAIETSSDAAWTGINLPRLVHQRLGTSVFFDYDVNAGAYAEHVLGSAVGRDRFLYLSVGTGIGGTFFVGRLRVGEPPQIGHMYLPVEPDDLAFPGSCRFHGRCLQGLASGRSIAERWGIPAEQLPPDHPALDVEARYLARACTNLVYTLLPEKSSSPRASPRFPVSPSERTGICTSF